MHTLTEMFNSHTTVHNCTVNDIIQRHTVVIYTSIGDVVVAELPHIHVDNWHKIFIVLGKYYLSNSSSKKIPTFSILYKCRDI